MRHRSLRLSMLALVFLASMVLSACAAFEPADCRKADMATYADAMSAKITMFQQQADLVSATPRVGLGTPLQRLLDLQNETREIVAPGCLRDFHEGILAAMQIQQRGFQQFAAQQGETVAVSYITIGKEDLVAAAADLDTIRAGVIPTPLPTPEPVSPPEPGVVGAATLLQTKPDGTGMFQVCPDDRFEIIGRQTVGEVVWARVRINRIGTAECLDLLPRAPKDFEGWLHDSDVKAP